MLRPAGTVIFSMTSVNSGSSGKAAEKIDVHLKEKKITLRWGEKTYKYISIL